MVRIRYIYKDDAKREIYTKYLYIGDYINFMKSMTSLILVQEHAELIHGDYVKR